MSVHTWDDPVRTDDFESGGERRVLGYTDDMMLVHYSLQAGDEGEPHTHEETVQASFVIDGELELRGEYDRIVEAGDSSIIPPGTTHGVYANTACTVIDAFSPPIAAYKTA